MAFHLADNPIIIDKPKLDNLGNENAWNKTKNYTIGDQVEKDFNTYKCVIENINEKPEISTSIFVPSISWTSGNANDIAEIGTNFSVNTSGVLTAVKIAKVTSQKLEGKRHVKVWSTNAMIGFNNNAGTGKLISYGNIDMSDAANEGPVTIPVYPVVLKKNIVYMVSYSTTGEVFPCSQSDTFVATVNQGIINPIKSGWSNPKPGQFPDVPASYQFYLDIVFESTNPCWVKIQGLPRIIGDISSHSNIATVNSIGGGLIKVDHIYDSILKTESSTFQSTPNSIIQRDNQGDFSANIITSDLIGNVIGNLTGHSDTSTYSEKSGIASLVKVIPVLSGDVENIDNEVIVKSIGGSLSADIHTAEKNVNQATHDNIQSTLVLRNILGDFSANDITASNFIGNLKGNATTSDFSNNSELAYNVVKIPILTGDVENGNIDNQVNIVKVGGSTASDIHRAEILANESTHLNKASSIARRDVSGNLYANNIYSDLIGNVFGNSTSSSTAEILTGSFGGDVSGTQLNMVVNYVGGSHASDVHNAVMKINSSTKFNNPLSVVSRDRDGNFSANIITATLNGSAASVDTIPVLSGDVVNNGNIINITSVGGSSSSKIHDAEVRTNGATALNTRSAIMSRDSAGNFAANIATLNKLNLGTFDDQYTISYTSSDKSINFSTDRGLSNPLSIFEKHTRIHNKYYLGVNVNIPIGNNTIEFLKMHTGGCSTIRLDFISDDLDIAGSENFITTSHRTKGDWCKLVDINESVVIDINVNINIVGLRLRCLNKISSGSLIISLEILTSKLTLEFPNTVSNTSSDITEYKY